MAVAYAEAVTTVGALVAPRTLAGQTQTNTTLLGVSTAADVGKSISGTGIPAGAYVTAVSAGTSWTLSAAATASASGVSVTIYQLLRAVASRTGFVRVYDPALGGATKDSANLPTVTVVTKHTVHDDAAPWYAEGTNAGAGQVGQVDVQLAVAAADVVNAASVQTFHADNTTLAVVATGPVA